MKWSYLSSEWIVSIKSDWRVWWLHQQPVGRNLERWHAGVQQGPRYRFTWKTKHYLSIIQWAPLNGIAVDGIIQFMGSTCTRFTSPKLLFYTYWRYLSSSFAYCFHSLTVSSLGLAQSDPIKWCLLHLVSFIGSQM